MCFKSKYRFLKKLILFFTCMAAGGFGIGCLEIGTQPMAAARANGSHAATDAIFA